MIYKRAVPVALIAGLIALVSPNAYADAKNDRLKRKADEYFTRAEVMFESGEFERAAAAFVLAYETYPYPAVLANIGLSYDKAGNVPKAVETLRFYLSQVDEQDIQKWVPGRLAYLEKQVGELTIKCLAQGCTVFVDNTQHKDTLKSLILVPGDYQIRAYKGQHLIDQTTVSVKAGRITDILVGDQSQDSEVMDFSTEEATSEPKVDTEEPSGEKRKMILKAPFWISASLTLAAGVTAIAFGAVTLQTEESFNNTEDTDLKDELRDQGTRQKIVTNVMIGIMSAGAVASVIFAVIDVRKAKKQRKEENANIRLNPMPGLGLGLTVNF